MRIAQPITNLELESGDEITISFSIHDPAANDREGGYRFGRLVLSHQAEKILVSVQSGDSIVLRKVKFAKERAKP